MDTPIVSTEPFGFSHRFAPEHLLTEAEVVLRIQERRSWIRSRVKRRTFPSPLRFGPRTCFFLWDEVAAAIDARERGDDDAMLATLVADLWKERVLELRLISQQLRGPSNVITDLDDRSRRPDGWSQLKTLCLDPGQKPSLLLLPFGYREALNRISSDCFPVQERRFLAPAWYISRRAVLRNNLANLAPELFAR